MPSDILDDIRPEYRFEKEAEKVSLPRALRRRLKRAGWDFDTYSTQSADAMIQRATILHRVVPNPLHAIEQTTQPAGASAQPEYVAQPPSQGEMMERRDGIAPAQGNGVKPSYPKGYQGSTPPRAQVARVVPLSPSELISLQLLRDGRRRVVVSLDAEFYYPVKGSNRRKVLSLQVAVIDPRDPSVIHELVFLSIDGTMLTVEQLLGYVIDRLGLPCTLRGLGDTACPDRGYAFKETRVWTVPTADTGGALWADQRTNRGKWQAFTSFAEARDACGDPAFRAAYDEIASTCSRPSACRLKHGDPGAHGLAGYTNDYAPYQRDKKYLELVLLCHFGRADLSALSVSSQGVDLMNLTSQVQRGTVSLSPLWLNARVPGAHWRFYPVRLDVRDTMCLAPAKERGLDALGESVGVPKLTLAKGFSKDAMDELLAKDAEQFLEYASQDPVVALCYAAALFGENRTLPVTASSAGVRAVVGIIKRAFGLEGTEEFDVFYRGLRRERCGMKWDKRSHRLRPKYKYEPLNDDCRIIQEYFRQSYKGGLNGCACPAWIAVPTYDLDLISAYPTAMCCVPDVDWEADKVIVREWADHDMVPDDFPDGPLVPMAAYVTSFEFPESCKYPCIGINIDGKLVYPRRLGHRDGVYATGVEIWLALKMGATVHVSHAYQAAIRRDSDGQPTHSLYHAVKTLVEDRFLVKSRLDDQPELSVIEKLLKQVVNALYGKTAQGVLEKRSWDALEQSMVDIGCSSITSPAHCAMTTAIVRCTLLAAMAELDQMEPGYESFSWTTDGFITEADAGVANSLELFGLAEHLREARVALSGDEKVWEEKHHQDCFLNITTRGNCAPNEGGVCAHNGYSTPFEHDTSGDRLNFLHHVLTRVGKVKTQILGFPGHRALSGKEGREEFHAYREERELSMDYDMKRRPVEATLETARPTIEDMTYEVACVDTAPYETPEEFEHWYALARSCRCLRTEDDWRLLFAKERMSDDGKSPQRHVSDLPWSRVMTCVMGHRLGIWTIPELGRDDITVAEKCAWVEGFNDSTKRHFTAASWKNARRQNRQGQMLPREEVADLLSAMGAVF